MNFHFGTYKTTIAVVLALGVLLMVAVIGREIYRAVHPPNKPSRKRKRRDF